MNREDVIRLAREAGIEFHERKNHLRIGTDILFGDDSTEKLERFAALVAAAEREACAMACEAVEEAADKLWDEKCDPHDQGCAHGASACAEAIRDRSHP